MKKPTFFTIRPHAPRRGFTLLEVMVSIGMISLLAPAIMYGMGLCSSAAAVARNRTLASTLAQQKIDELVVNYSVLGNDLSDVDGTFDQYPEYRWDAKVVDWDTPVVDNINSDMKELDVTVTWQEKGRDRGVTLSTLVYEPPVPTGGNTLPGGLP